MLGSTAIPTSPVKKETTNCHEPMLVHKANLIPSGGVWILAREKQRGQVARSHIYIYIYIYIISIYIYMGDCRLGALWEAVLPHGARRPPKIRP